jgi:N-acetylglucosamine kinase-like BadF-type ATPase
MLQAALAHWSLKDAKDLIGFAYRDATRPDVIATFAARVLELAARHDAAAQAIVDETGEALALHVDTVAQTLGLTTPPLALGGSMTRAGIKKAILARVKTPLGPVATVADPVLGAVAAARRLFEKRTAA